MNDKEMDFGTYGSLEVKYDLDDNFDSDRFIKMRLRICHDGVNRNGSNFTVENFKDAESTLANIPILANVLFDEDGTPQFGGHDMTIEKNKLEGDAYKMIYQEVPIGVVPETCNPEIKEFEGKQYVYADAYIWRGYSNYAEDIINRDKDIKLSMEITVDDCAFDTEKNVYNVNKYRYRGITFLGNDLQTGMVDAMATTNFTEDSKEKMIVMMKELKDVLEKFSAVTEAERGEMEMNDTQDMKMAEEVSVTEGVENKGAEEFTQTAPEVTDTDATPDAPVAEDFTTEDMRVVFSISHEDIRYGLYNLIDEDCYILNVYDNFFEYHSCLDNKFYRQSYTVDDTVVSLGDDKVEVFPQMLTADEKAAVDAMNNDFSELKTEVEGLREFKAGIDAERHNAEVQSVVDKWSEHLDGNEAFEKIKSSNFAELSPVDVEVQCKCIFADTKATFNEVKSAPKDTMVRFSLVEDSGAKEKPYGGLFDEYINID